MGKTIESVIASLEKRLEDASKASDEAIEEMIKELNDVKLHDYQLEGIKWLAHRDQADLNVILGDEMGLGKTLQTIAFICLLKKLYKSKFESCLILAPLSVLPNWQEQLKRFAPTLTITVYSGDKMERQQLNSKFKSAPTTVLLTSYETILRDISFFKQSCWTLAVFDEGHRLKNPKSQIHQALGETIPLKRKLLLTGTPVQNNMSELMALLSFLNPSVFDSSVCASIVKNGVASPSTLRAILAPIMLLRTVSDVQDALQLPPLTKVVIHTEMSAMQRAYYKQVVSKGTAFKISSHLSLMNILSQLRKACNHPYLFPNAEPEPFQEGPHLYMNSGKLFVLHTLLPVLKRRGHVVLLFSTSTAFLDIIQDYCTLEKFSYERLDGSVRGEERWQTIDRFRKNDSDTFIFLLSTRAGGVGLNLQRADTVIFCDVDYNPQMELQALARAYRMGQTKAIHVMHLVCAHSVEEIIYKRSLTKLNLSSTIRACSKVKVNESENSVDPTEDMLIYGLHHIVNQPEDSELVPLSKRQVEALLNRGTESVVVIPGIEDAPQDENLYYFEGTDYSIQDAAGYKALKKKSANKPTSRQMQPRHAIYEDDDEEDFEVDDETLNKLAEKRREKKAAQWLKNNYTSHVIHETSDGKEVHEEIDNEEMPQSIEYVSGNAATVQFIAEPVIIVHCVDTSGSWTPRGFFGAISSRSKLPEKVYSDAKQNRDLKLGQAHFIPIGNNVYICLLIVQSFLHQVKKRTKKTLTIRLNSLQLALEALAFKAKELNASVHMPRLGAGTPGFNWYAVERLIKKHLRHIPTSVYYFTPSSKRQKVNDD